MKHLGQRYVQHFNRKHGRTGSLWEGRFRSSIVDSEGYLLRCQRYIEMNPMRAGIVTCLDDYPWSSYASNANGVPSTLLSPHVLYLSLANDQDARLTAYRQLFGTPLSVDELREIRDAANGGFALGRAGFLTNLEHLLKRPVASGVSGRPRKRMQ
jgi:putative transposase